MTEPTFVGRGRLRARRTLLTLTTALCTGLATPAFAGSPHPNLDANGIDLTTGEFSLQLPVASIGSGASELPLIVYSRDYDNWTGFSSRQTSSVGGNFITIDFGPQYDTFKSTDGYANSIRGTGATLSFSGNQIVYRTLDGTTLVFGDPIGSGSGLCDTSTAANCTRLPISITRRNGMTVAFDWTVHELCSTPTSPGDEPMPDEDPVCTYSWRLGGVSNSAGYSITYGYATDSVPYNQHPGAAWFQRTSAALSNGGSSRTVSYAYPSSSAFTVTTPGGKTWRITNSGSLITGVRRPSASSDTTTISYTSFVPTSVTKDGVTTGYNYGVSSNTATMVVTDALSQQTTIVSDLAKFRPTSVTDALSHTTTMSYDSVGRPTEVSYPEGNKVQYSYDSRGNLTATTWVAKSGSGLSNIVTSASFPSSCTDAACNEPTTTTDARGNVTDYAYDGTTGLVTSVAAPAATTGATRAQTRYSYTTVAGVSMLTGVSTCRTGSASSCVGTADEVKTTTSYNSNLLLTRISRGAGDASLTATTALGYDPDGNLLTVDGPLSGAADTVTYRWSADRERLGVISPDPDGSGSLKRRAIRTSYTSDGLPNVTDLGIVAGTSDSDWAAFSSQQQVTASYDGNARKTKDVLTAGGTTYQVTQYGYDGDGRPECVAQRLNSATWSSLPFSACTLGTTGSYGPDRIVKTTYDAADQITKTTSAYGVSGVQADDATVVYTSNGKAASVTDAEGNRTSFSYDGHDRLVQTNYPSTTKGAGTSSSGDYEQLTLDAAGNVTSRRLRDATSIGYSYDADGRLTSKDLPGSEPDVTTGYDLLDRPVSIATSVQTLTLGYDALGRVTSQGGPLGTVASQYDLADRRTRLTWPDNLYVGYDYDVTGNLTAIRENGATSGVGVLASYGYDDLGRRTSAAYGNGTGGSWSWDAVSRLSGLSHDLAGTGYDVSWTLGYTPAGQLASEARGNDAYAFGFSNGTTATTTDGLNRATAAGSTSIGYDSRGNTTSIGSASFGYSSENLLTSGPSSATLAYDPALRLYQTTGGTTTRFQYDGTDLVAEYSASNTLQRRYVPGAGTDDPVVWYEGSGTSDRRWLHADPRGSVVAVTNASGTTLSVNAYDEYGKPASSNTGRFGYTGQTWLPELGQWYYKARMYAPSLGRFLQTDPVGYGDGLNWYGYVKGDPVNATDPSGKFGDQTVNENIDTWSLMARLGGDEYEHQNAGPVGGGGHDYSFAWANNGDLNLGVGPVTHGISIGEAWRAMVAPIDKQYGTGLGRLYPGKLSIDYKLGDFVGHVAAGHFGYDYSKSSVFSSSFQSEGALYSLAMMVANSVPLRPSNNGYFQYTARYPRVVGYLRYSGEATNFVTFIVANTGRIDEYGRRVFRPVTIYPSTSGGQ